MLFDFLGGFLVGRLWRFGWMFVFLGFFWEVFWGCWWVLWCRFLVWVYSFFLVGFSCFFWGCRVYRVFLRGCWLGVYRVVFFLIDGVFLGCWEFVGGV